MGKEVDPKSGSPKPEPKPDEGLLAKLTAAVDGLLERVKVVEEKQTSQAKTEEKVESLWERLFGEAKAEKPKVDA